MTPLLFEMSAAAGLAERLCRKIGGKLGQLEHRRFPDGESFVRLMTDVEGRDLVFLCTLDRPDTKVLPLLFAAAAARAQGARSIGLVAPYLAYMRQDRAFQKGEAVTSQTFADLLSDRFDWLVTVDPHLHRYRELSEIYSLPVIDVGAAAAIGEWIDAEIDNPVIIGPDEESRQWAKKVAEAAAAKLAVLRKHRSGDYSVSIDESGLSEIESGTAVIVDDIVSSASTMIEAVDLLKGHGLRVGACVAIHPVFAGDSYDRLKQAGPLRIASTNTIDHESNVIDICDPLGKAVIDALSIVARRDPAATADSQPAG